MRDVIAPQAALPMDRLRLQKWRSLLAIGGLLVAGCLLLLHLHVVDSLTAYISIRDIQGDLPLLELPSDILLQEIINENNIRNIGDEGQGIPEAEMAAPVVPLLEKEELEVPVPVVKPNASWCHYQDLKKALTEIVDGKQVFVLVIPDVDHVDLAKNTLQSIKRFTDKKNLLFVCRDVMLCEATEQHGIPCYIDESSPGSSAPVFKTIAKVLEMNYIPVYIDFDTSLTKPLPDLPEGGIDMVIPNGNTPKAHSFFINLNTPGTLRFHKAAIQDAEKNVNKSFAAVFKSVLNMVQKKKSPFKLAKLPKCTKLPVEPECCIMRHLTFSSPADRALWLKEKQQWFSDMHGYYSDPDALYITYENNYDMGKRTIEYEIHALKNALAYAQILNRTIILPKFLCLKCIRGKCKQNNCLLSHFLNLTRFDEVFGTWYREHSFRGHPLVPLSTKKSVSEVLQVSSPLHKGMLRAGGVKIPSKITINKLINANNIEGPNSDEVKDLFEEYSKKSKILIFSDLYGAFSGFTTAKDSLEFEMKLKKGIVLSSKT